MATRFTSHRPDGSVCGRSALVTTMAKGQDWFGMKSDVVGKKS